MLNLFFDTWNYVLISKSSSYVYFEQLPRLTIDNERRYEMLNWNEKEFVMQLKCGSTRVLQSHRTTNIGYVAWRCFQDPKKFDETLEIDDSMVASISRILSKFKSNQPQFVVNEFDLCVNSVSVMLDK